MFCDCFSENHAGMTTANVQLHAVWQTVPEKIYSIKKYFRKHVFLFYPQPHPFLRETRAQSGGEAKTVPQTVLPSQKSPLNYSPSHENKLYGGTRNTSHY